MFTVTRRFLWILLMTVFVLALPLRGFADPPRDCDRYDYGREYQYDRPPLWRPWRALTEERDEIAQRQAVLRRDWRKWQEEQRELRDDQRAREWGAFRQDQYEAWAAARALQRDQAQLGRDRWELARERRAFADRQSCRHGRRDWDDGEN